jgi:hypothetical protein
MAGGLFLTAVWGDVLRLRTARPSQNADKYQ